MNAPEETTQATTQPLAEKDETVRARLGTRAELTLALLPTVTVLLVFQPGSRTGL